MKGFTLMEVLVALSVFAVASLACGRYIDGFLRIRNVEREQALAFTCGVQAMEDWIRQVMPCNTVSKVIEGDGCPVVQITLTPVGGYVPLAVARVVAPAVRPVTFTRLVECKNIED
ncbi:MAG: prepilin-type N-terminal cleavage/methylation domain-containing protein [Fibrobacter sp.]|nr:prepilin-type N-terminal cleavage/methylation domain-containing protein [Fibrobacter sp.]